MAPAARAVTASASAAAAAAAVVTPTRTIYQIALLQLFYYVCLGALMLFTMLVMGESLTWGCIFDFRQMNAATVDGIILGIVYLLNSVPGVILLMLIVKRSKLVLDFTATLHIVHVILVSVYSRQVPTSAYWWLIEFSNVAIMVFAGEFACMQRELEPIPFGERWQRRQDEYEMVSRSSADDDEDSDNDDRNDGAPKAKADIV